MLEIELALQLNGLSSRRKYLVGVSGGCDSLVLLHALHERGYRKLVVCHLNHQLRGRASEADARLVARMAECYGYPKLIAKRNLTQRPPGISLETAARVARQEFFADCAVQQRCRTVLLAHHADDQVETVLMNVLRGTALHGLGGIRHTSEWPAQPCPLQIVRPLLACWRSELRAYAKAHRVNYREDASNESREHLRNRLRHDLLPQASATLRRDVRRALLRLAATAQADDACLTALAAPLAASDMLEPAPLLNAPLALQRRALHTWLQRHAIPEITFDLIETLRALLPPTASTAKANLPGGQWVRRRAGRLFLEYPRL